MGHPCYRTGQCLSGNAFQRGHCGTVAGLVRHGHQACWPVWGAEAHGFIAAPCSFRDRGAAAGPCGCLCIDLMGFVPTSSNRCSCLPALRFAGEKLPLHLNMQCKINYVHQHHCFIIIWSLEAIGAEPQTRVNFWKHS